ncbi:MAG TPA: flagellar filament capping protein FliD [Ilumatobacter sp.]|nr:flagellar filament capping protein FliD [Ilumatobacter sp.]
MNLGGIDAQSIVSQLMALERQPLNALNTRKQSAQTAVNTLNALKTAITSIQTAAGKLATSGGVARYAATVSNPDAIAANVTGTAGAGSLTFQVLSLAGSAATRSGTVANQNVPITAAARLAVAAGTQAMGISSVRAADTTATGSYGVTTTAAAGAGVQLVAKAAVDAPVTITAGDNAFTMLVDGQFRAVTIDAGTYTDASAVAAAVQSAVTAAGIDATVGVESGALSFTGGAVTSLGIVAGGSALGALGLSSGATVVGGAAVEINGSVTAVDASVASGTLTVAAGTSTLDLNLGGAIQTGQATVKVVDTGDQSLAAVASAISAANGGVSASAVNTGSGWLLQLGSNVTGTDGNLAIDLDVLTLSGWQSTGSAANAVIQVGEGPGAYTVEAQGNTFTDLISGVTLTAKAVTTGPVTVTVGQNNAAVADDVEALVNQVNSVLGQIKTATAWNPATKTGGPLLGDSSIRRLAAELTSALSGVVGDVATGRVPGTYGIDLQKDGTFAFDKAKFSAALDADPALAGELLSGSDTVPGVASRLDKLAAELVHWEQGLLTTTTKAAESRITRFTEQIERLEDRLAIRETNMARQWSALQSLLAQMQNQGTWLESQLATLPTIKSN